MPGAIFDTPGCFSLDVSHDMQRLQRQELRGIPGRMCFIQQIQGPLPER
jgi:hypothetical protein